MPDEIRVPDLPTNIGGRPVIFDAEMKERFLERLSAGLSNAEACAAVGIARPTLHWHLSRDPEFREQYEIAKATAVDALIDKCDELAEQATSAETGAQVAGIKVAMDHYWRKAGRIAPHKWGERPSLAVVVSEVKDPCETAKRLAFLEALEGGSDED